MVEKAGKIARKSNCKDKDGEWFEGPIPLCVTDSRVEIPEIENLYCDCASSYGASGTDCSCVYMEGGDSATMTRLEIWVEDLEVSSKTSEIGEV